MRVVCDIEANSLNNPTQIWLIVCKDIDTKQYYIFRNVTSDKEQRDAFLLLAKNVRTWIGHNFLGYDCPVLSDLLGFVLDDSASSCIDTLIISKLVNYSREGGHSLERYGQELGLEKIKFSDWTKYSPEMETYCVRDVDLCEAIYLGYRHILDNENYHSSISLEHQFQLIVNGLHRNGFGFDTDGATRLLQRVEEELGGLDKEILNSFPPKLKLLKEIHPEVTKHGTLHRKDFRWVTNGDLSEYNGGPFCRCHYVSFNPSSHKQLVEVLNNAGWRPIDKTTTHIQIERTINRLKYRKEKTKEVDIQLKECYADLKTMGVYGWRVNENNLSSLPENAPSPAKTLSKRILLESRRRTLTEWLGLVNEDSRIRGQFYGIGAWTHRMSHQRPNTANIPTPAKLLGHEMRSLWQAPEGRLLVGVDAKGIQLRIFAHYVDDPEFTKEVVDGDPHSLNQRVIGQLCQTRDAAKRFIYALLLGAGIGKLSEILGVNREEGQQALDRIICRYPGLQFIQSNTIPADARRGYFIGLDGRKVLIPGDTQGERKHLCMSGYLQNGEAIIMKKACVKWHTYLTSVTVPYWKLVNFVHDEWQTEVNGDKEVAQYVANIQVNSIKTVGEELRLRCPLAGSFKIGFNWSETH